MAIRVLITDDHGVVRQGLHTYLSRDPELEVVGEATNGEEAVAMARDLCPDVVLMDLLMPVMDGMEATGVIRTELPGVEVVALTSVLEDASVAGASQALYGIVLSARSARDALDAGDHEGTARPLDHVLSLSRASLSEMRALIFELRPESLLREGLVAALEKQAAAMEERHGLRVEADLHDEPEASPAAKEAVYRIAQEALHNTLKHARASGVKLELRWDGSRIALEVFDDGAGFDAGDDFPGHLGLRSMRERAARLGGALEIESTPGRGTRIRARIPV